MRRILIGALCLAVLLAGLPAANTADAALMSSISSLKIVFSAASRDPVLAATGAQMIYTTGPGGSAIRQITTFDGWTYDWPMWAFGGTKILYSSRKVTGPDDSSNPENLYLMDPDGTNRIQLTRASWRSVQPRLSPDGRTVLFTALWPEFPRVALFKLDLATLEITNLSQAKPTSDSSLDSDPRWVGSGESILFASSMDDNGVVVPTQTYLMAADGGQRRRITRDSFYNTDPALSPDGNRLAVSSYRGEGTPHKEGSKDEFAAKLHDWHLVVSDLTTRTERVLTQGKSCAIRVPPEPTCSPTEGPSWVPHWTPDGKSLGFLSVRNVFLMGLYLVSPDGGPAQPVFETSELALTWYDWIATSASWAGAPVIGEAADTGMLIGGVIGEGKGVLLRSTPDRFTEAAIVSSIPNLVPRSARWTPDGEHIVFTAVRPMDSADAPSAAPDRQVRFTLPEFTQPYAAFPDQSIADEQVYVMDPDGRNAHQLTTPWTEDHIEAIGEGDRRANVEPDVSPDGRYVIFTSISTSVDETMILRLDVLTGDVLNLSAVTAGALPVRDAAARYSPDGTRIAFTSTVGAVRQIFLMNGDGSGIRQLTDDDSSKYDPAWSPDGTSLAYSRRSEVDTEADETTGWTIVRLDLASGRERVLTRVENSPAYRPVWSPDGQRIAYLSAAKTVPQPDLRLVDADGSNDRIVVTLRTREAFVDWR